MTNRPDMAARPRRPPWPMIAGVAVLAVLALILLLILITRGPGGEATGSVTPTPSSAQATAAGSATASASAEASATIPGQPNLATDTIVAATVEGLTVRESPGLDAKRLGTLEEGALSFVAGGPTDADGFRWYLVSGLGLPPNTGCAGPFEADPFNCPIWFGWVAAASESGEPWLVEHDIACPEAPYTAANLGIGRTGLERLACFGSEAVTFRGYWPEIPDDVGQGGECEAEDEPSGWLLCQDPTFYNTSVNNVVVIDETQDFDGIGIRIAIDPASDVTMPERGTWVEVRVHLDDPAAQGCAIEGAVGGLDDRPIEQKVLGCRAEAVLEEARAVDGP